MRASDILQEELREGGEFLHAKQWAALWRAVVGLLKGRQLWLTALGRSLPGECADKHRIKAIDRLAGSAAVQMAVPRLYAALAKFLLAGIRRPVILVDWTGGGPAFYILSAKLCFRGRALSICSRTFPIKRKCSPRAEREFLDVLANVIPGGCTPILVTDAGFHIEWFDEVQRRGWEFVGRVRGKLTVSFEQTWLPLGQLHALARNKPKDLGKLKLRRKNPCEYRLVLSAKRKLKGRKQLTLNGNPRQRTADHQLRKAAREPWLLATSLSDCARVVVEAYAMRMQIEQTFRDLKSHRYGWSFEDMRCRTPARVDVLLLVAALAAVAMHMVGLAAFERRLDYGLQANTERRRRVFSTFFLAKLIISQGIDSLLSTSLLRAALARLRHLVASVALSGLRPQTLDLAAA
jgi:hypothetical protein